jgi:hypothetical protein
MRAKRLAKLTSTPKKVPDLKEALARVDRRMTAKREENHATRRGQKRRNETRDFTTAAGEEWAGDDRRV